MGTPKGGVILFDGTSLDQWVNHAGQTAEWALEHGAMRVVPGMKGIGTAEKFEDHFLHLEFKPSDMPEAAGQQKSNSDVFQ